MAMFSKSSVVPRWSKKLGPRLVISLSSSYPRHDLCGTAIGLPIN